MCSLIYDCLVASCALMIFFSTLLCDVYSIYFAYSALYNGSCVALLLKTGLSFQVCVLFSVVLLIWHDVRCDQVDWVFWDPRHDSQPISFIFWSWLLTVFFTIHAQIRSAHVYHLEEPRTYVVYCDVALRSNSFIDIQNLENSIHEIYHAIYTLSPK